MVYARLPWIGFVVALSMTGATAKAETIQVTIDKLVFSPRILNAKVGDTIEWINKDILDHTATVKGGWDVLIPAGKSASLILDGDQSVEYYCRFHPNMRGRVTVTAP